LGLGAGALALGIQLAAASPAGAQSLREQWGSTGERYVPTIWVDPDGCQHWVMDDGAEGYMTPNRTRDGKPVCVRGNPCHIENSDTLFATGSHAISAQGRARLIEFFRTAPVTAFVIDGHTDPRGGYDYNMRLSLNRANAVAAIAREVGVTVADVRGFAFLYPRAPNTSAAGMALNRRVEIFCIR
jgi:outer membrane protein OmpA-like peptidoglycan-associated protein